MPESIILGPDARPLRVQSRADLARPYAVPTLTGVRQPWDATSIADGLTPESLASALRQADSGDGYAYLTLAHEVERRNAHYRSVLGTRRQAVLGLPVTVESASDEAADVRLADEVRDLLRVPGLRHARGHLLDAVAKGYSVVELAWDTSRTPWVPRPHVDKRTGQRVEGYRWLDPRWFVWHPYRPDELRLRDDADPTYGLGLPPYRYLVHAPDLLSGHPLSRGLTRTACILYMAQSFAVGDWLRFADTYGLPMRVGKYGAGASAEDIAVLTAAVANLGTDWGAAIPESMQIELIQAAIGQGSDIFERLARWAGQQLSILALGQVASTEGQPGALGGNAAQDEVRQDIRDADAEDLAETLNRDLVGAYLALNHGAMEPEDAPRVVIAEPDAEDTATLVDALSRLIPLGLRVSASVIRDKLGLPDPADDEELLGPSSAASPIEGMAGPGAPGTATPRPEANRAQRNRVAADETDYADAQTERLGRAAEPAVRERLAQVRAQMDDLILSGGELADLMPRLDALAQELPPAALTATLAEALAAAELAGRAEVLDETPPEDRDVV